MCIYIPNHYIYSLAVFSSERWDAEEMKYFFANYNSKAITLYFSL